MVDKHKDDKPFRRQKRKKKKYITSRGESTFGWRGWKSRKVKEAQ